MASIANDLESLSINGTPMPLGEEKSVIHLGKNVHEGMTSADGSTHLKRRATVAKIMANLIEPYNTTEKLEEYENELVTAAVVTNQGRRYVLANATLSYDEGGVRDAESMLAITLIGQLQVQVSE